MKKRIISILAGLMLLPWAVESQRLIEYTSGIGSRNPDNGDVWILYNGVKAMHEGMSLLSDSAHYNTAENSFTAFNNVVIELTDTTLIYGDRLYYDGNSRVVDIWADTVLLVDGHNTLRANHLTYDRNQETAFYTEWGHGISEDRTLDSKQGQYNSIRKEFYIYIDVHLSDSTMMMVTDTLIYNTNNKVAHFESGTYIYSDSSTIYSELGDYNTETRFAISFKASHVENQGRMINSDTLYYDEVQEYGKAFGNVQIVDSVNNIVCTGRYGETNQAQHFSFVTDSAHVLFIESGDSLFLHADTIYIINNQDNRLETVRANFHVKAYRRDAQAMCDSAFYNALDSTLTLYRNPILWYEHYQCSADTIELLHDTSGISQAYLRSDCFAMQQVDRDNFDQLKGKQGIVYFNRGNPAYADILGNAQMVFHITETSAGGEQRMVGVNAGIGTDIRIYFDSTRAPVRVVTYDKPDMQTYPLKDLPDEYRRLPGFNWTPGQRPRRPKDVFVW